jgi:hypothetical protein
MHLFRRKFTGSGYSGTHLNLVKSHLRDTLRPFPSTTSHSSLDACGQRTLMPTAYEIYQTYLKGLAALIRLFEQALLWSCF